MSCLVIGDSIAVGVALAMPECAAIARGGISATDFVRTFGTPSGDTTVISLGSNEGPDDINALLELRARLSGRVIWLLPPSRLRQEIAGIAYRYIDRVVDVRDGGATASHIHPNAAGYARIAERLR